MKKRDQTMIPCPDCAGTGRSTGFACPGFQPVGITCLRCDGQKQVPTEMKDWIQHGKKLRQARMLPYRTQHEEAKRRCLDLLEYAALEQGHFNNLGVRINQ